MLSHPTPEDRNPAPESPVDIRAALIQLRKPGEEGGEGLSNAVIAAGIGKSETTVSQYINGKYPGNVAGLEAALGVWLRLRHVAKITGIETIETEVSRIIRRKLEEIRTNSLLGIITGPAGLGKSRGGELYRKYNPLVIYFRVLPWHSGITCLAKDLCQAASIDRLAKGESRWDTIIGKTAGSGRMLVVDDAHELGPRALQCCVDWHEETGNPVALIGLEHLSKRLLTDSRRARRVGESMPLDCKDPQPLVAHLVDQLASDCAGSDRAELIKLGLQVANHDGRFGALEQQLKKAARNREKNSSLTWTASFRAAHERLLRGYTLN